MWTRWVGVTTCIRVGGALMAVILLDGAKDKNGEITEGMEEEAAY
jgi:hypothetical protein